MNPVTKMDIQFVTFRIGLHLFAVDIMRVKEIILPVPVSPLPKSSPVIEGIINLRNQVVPLLSLKKRLDLPGDAELLNCKYILLNYVSRSIAVSVDEVQDVKTVSSDSISIPPDVDDGVSSEYLIGVFLSDDNMYMIINPDSICSPADSIQYPNSPENGPHLS